MKVSSQRLSIKTPSPKKSSGMGPTGSSTEAGVRSLKTYTKAALREPLSFGDTGLIQTPSLLGMSQPATGVAPKKRKGMR